MVSDKHVKFTKSEVSFLLENVVCRVATSHNDIPHIVPVDYIHENNFIYFAIDYGTKKYQNLQKKIFILNFYYKFLNSTIQRFINLELRILQKINCISICIL